MRYKSEIFDHLQYLYKTTGFNDHQLHCVIKFENKLDTKVIEAAVRYLIEILPALSRVYRNHNGKSYWEDVDLKNLNSYINIVNDQRKFEEFTYRNIEEEIGPQIKVCLLSSDKDALSIIINHMVMDGAGLKQCVYLLSDLYTKIIKNPGYIPEYTIDGDRSFKDIIAGFKIKDRIKILLFDKKDSNQACNDIFPMSSDKNISPFIMTRELSPERFHHINSYCKNHKVTVNDVILTAYFRVLSKMLKKEGKILKVPIMVDMRRYLKDKSFKAITNLSSTVIISICIEPKEDFNETLEKVNTTMNLKKNNNLGISTFIKLDTLYRICGRKIGYAVLKKSLKNAYITMTNIGVMDAQLLHFDGSPIESAFICGSIKYRPYFQLAVTSFNDKITFCVNSYGSQKERDMFQRFFELMNQELLFK